MNRQEINLYREISRRTSDSSFITKKILINIYIAFTIFNLILYGITLLNIKQLHSQSTSLKNEIQQTKDLFFKYKEGFPEIFFSKDTKQSIDKLKSQIEQQQKILNAIADNETFSSYLTALALTINPNVWLTEINIYQSGDIIMLNGKASNKLAIQDFIASTKLNNMLGKFKVESQELGGMRPTDKDTYLKFTIKMIKNHG